MVSTISRGKVTAFVIERINCPAAPAGANQRPPPTTLPPPYDPSSLLPHMRHQKRVGGDVAVV